MSQLPLAGVKVIDLTTVIMGPYAAQWLADLGAEVIKVETPLGDSTRFTGPSVEPGMSSLFLGANRNKKAVVIDIKKPDGRDALLHLIGQADVFMHNMRPQKLGAVGLDPDTLRKKHPRLVYAGLHGFGQDGPYGGRPAYDDIIQGMAGNVAMMAQQGGVPR
jgi:crotonobetainyl-CoA:carnitine CoA-transferase CaiB-like acyl-CoA transferase